MEGGNCLAEALKSNTTLTCLNLCQCNAGYKNIVRILKTNTSVTDLDISCTQNDNNNNDNNNDITWRFICNIANRLGPAALIEVYEALKTNKTIKVLNVVGTHIQQQQHFFFSLKYMHIGNNASTESSKVLAAALKVNDTLETLSKIAITV